VDPGPEVVLRRARDIAGAGRDEEVQNWLRLAGSSRAATATTCGIAADVTP
jgi:hypothetical protein